MPSRPIRVAVIEDQRLFRQLLVRLLRTDGRYALAGEAEEVEAAVALCVRERPDLVLLDLQLPGGGGGGGLEVARHVRAASPDGPRFLALTSLQDNYTIGAVAEARLHGYVEKDQPVEVLEEAIAAVAAGRRWFSPAFEAARLRAAADPHDWRKLLSDRETEVLAEVGALRTSTDIAARLGLSQRTVETHRYHIMRKLGIADAPGLARFAIEQGLARPGPPAPDPGRAAAP